MLGKASEIKAARIEYMKPFTFNIDEYMKHKRPHELINDWLEKHPTYQILSVSIYPSGGNEVVMILYKEETP